MQSPISEQKLQRILSWSKGKKPGPYSLEVYPTNICNLKCIMCGTPTKKRIDIPKNRLIAVLKNAKELGVENITICGGGEPFFYRQDILSIMRLVKKLGMEGCITTNGTLLTEKMVKDIVLMKWDEVIFSIDSPTARTHDLIRGVPGAFKKSVKSMGWCREYKKKYGLKNLKIKINMVLMNKNYDDLIGMVDLARKMGCNDISFQVMYINTKEAENLELNREQRNQVIKKINIINSYAEDAGIVTNLDDLLVNLLPLKSDVRYKLLIPANEEMNNSVVSAPCYEPWLSANIYSDGRIGPCPRITEKSIINISGCSLRKIWYGLFFTKIRDDILNGKMSGYCENCCAFKIAGNLNLRQGIKKTADKLKKKN
jgi:MoaA/NifB/PqqE/SkfB family radical SAM enzyme